MFPMYLYTSGIVVAIVILLIIKYYVDSSKDKAKKTVPGLKPSDPESGNFPDVAKSGSIHEFLMDLHKKYGHIASFWWGKQWTVSISSPDLFKQHSKVFDRPAELFALLVPFITDNAIHYANGSEGKFRHSTYSRCFSENAMGSYFSSLDRITQETVEDLAKKPDDEHVQLRKYIFVFTIKSVLIAVYGEYFNDDKAILDLQTSYDYVWNDLESQVGGDPLIEGTERMTIFKQESRKIHNIMRAALEKARDNPSDNPSKSNFLDVISNLDITMDEKMADMVGIFAASFHTTGLLLTWCVYFLAKHPEVQRKAAEEAERLPTELKNMSKFVYIRQVINETMRCAVLTPYAARYSDDETHLGGYEIPPGTPVLHALGVSMQNPNIWPNPEKFDPDRFSPMNRKKIPSFGFEPFGFAGKRKCMGYRFSLAESIILLTNLLRKFEINLVPGQEEVVADYGLVATPRQEIWVTFKNKN